MHLCGRLTVSVGERRVERELPGRQARLLLAYLLVHRARECTRPELVDGIWGEEPPERVDTALSALLSKLRRILGAASFDGRGTLRIVPPAGSWLDLEAATDALHRAEAAAARGDHADAWAPARVAQHVALREFLPGDDAAWIDEVRRRLADVRLRSLEIVAQSSLALSAAELPTAERAARRLVEEAPYRESGYRLLMDVLATRGDVAEATLVYDRLRRLLRDDLGLAPGTATKAAYERLLKGNR